MSGEIKTLGGDTNIADMVHPEKQPSKILNFYDGANVFVTGATGFLGKMIMEKLIRTCPGVNKVYILVRVKKDKSVEERFKTLFEHVFFDRLKSEQPNFAEKIVPVPGDCVLPYLGISDEDRQKLINEINCVFHCAATVRFDEKIRTACYINVRATRDLLRLSREMKQLKSFIYVGTAFSNCIRKEINEEFYEPTISGEKLLTFVESLNDQMLDSATPIVIGKWPNTYAFTKAIAEEVIKTEGKGLPVAVVRPSIVIATVKEPVAGYIDNVYGATGVLLGVALGMIRTLHCKADCLADMVPADYVINCSIAAAWEVGTTKESVANKEISDNEGPESAQSHENDIPIYNYVCSTQKPIVWREFMRLAEIHLKQVPSPLLIWHYCFFLTPSHYLHMIMSFFLHKVPAYIVDFIAVCIRREPMLVKGYKKIDKFLDVLSYFATQQWRFRNCNTQELWKKLNKEDQKLFDFDMNAFEWDAYFYTYARGGRLYLINDPLDTIPQGRKRYRKLQIAHYTLVTLILVGFFYLIWNIVLLLGF